MPTNNNWGEIYCSSDWGDEDYNTRSLGFDGVPACFNNAYTYAEAYEVRVLADSGIVEGFECLENAIDELNFN
jgi:hypothetical protein